MAFRYLLPALAVAGRAAAGCSGTSTIQNQGDAMALSTCSTFSGSIAIATNTADDISLDGIQKITGSLMAKNVPHMSSLSATQLSSIGDTFSLNNIQILTTLSFPSLRSVDTIAWTALPNLQGLAFTQSVQQASSVSITNTNLGSLEGIDIEEVDTLFIADNNYLNDVSMQLSHATKEIVVFANGLNVHASFPNLIWANQVGFRNCSSVDLPSLSATNGSLTLNSNLFETFSAPNLTSVGGTLSFVSNADMTNISMPSLKTVSGGLQVANNTQFSSISFPRVATVLGAVDFNGEFTSVSLPSLNYVKGAFNLQSTKDISNACNHFQPLKNSGVIRGTYTCVTAARHPGGVGTGGSGISSGSGGSGDSGSGASTLYVSGAAGLMSVVAVLFTLL